MGSANARFAIGLLLGIVVGSATVYSLVWIGSPVRARAPAALLPESGELPLPLGKPAAVRLDAPEVEPERSELAPEAVRAARIEVPDSEVERLVSAAGRPTIERERGQGRIWGQVRDADGVGVGGVVLVARGISSLRRIESPSDVGQDPPGRAHLETTVREAVERFAESESNRFEARTDASGSYRFDELPEKLWSISAYKSAHVVSARGNQTYVSVGSELNFDAEPVIVLPVAIRMPGGSGASEAHVSTRKAGARRATLYEWSSDEPALRLAPGSYELVALAQPLPTLSLSSREEGYELRSLERKVLLEAGAVPETVSFTLEGQSGIRGMVRLPDDSVELRSVRVVLMALGQEREVNLDLLAKSELNKHVTRGFQFPDLKPGAYAVGVCRARNDPVAVHQVVEVAETMVECELELPAVDLEQYLLVQVLDTEGMPLADVRFGLNRSGGFGSSWGGFRPMRMRDGRYLVSIPLESRAAYFGGGEGIEFSLNVTHESVGSKEVPLEPGQRELTVSFGMPAELEVAVTGYSASDVIGNLYARASREAEQNHFSRGTPIGADGVATLPPLDPGEYEIQLTVRSSEGWPHTVATRSTELVAGPNRVEIALPPLHSFSVHAAGMEVGGMARLVPDGLFTEGQAEITTRLGAGEIAEFLHVPAGAYMLSVHGKKNGQMLVHVPCGDLEFESETMNAVRVRITDPEGVLARAGLRDGDLILGFGDESFSEGVDYSGLRDLYKEDAMSVEIQIQRGNRQLTVEVEAADIGEWKDLGARLKPTRL